MEQDLRELFQTLTRRFSFLDKNCCRVDGAHISLVQSHILYEISRRNRPSIQQVAESLGTDITTFSRQINGLVRNNLVKKMPDPDDRRVSLLELTEEGEKVVSSVTCQMNQYLKEVFSHMNDFEKETVVRSIQLLNQCMSKSDMCCSKPAHEK